MIVYLSSSDPDWCLAMDALLHQRGHQRVHELNAANLDVLLLGPGSKISIEEEEDIWIVTTEKTFADEYPYSNIAHVTHPYAFSEILLIAEQKEEDISYFSIRKLLSTKRLTETLLEELYYSAMTDPYDVFLGLSWNASFKEIQTLKEELNELLESQRRMDPKNVQLAVVCGTIDDAFAIFMTPETHSLYVNSLQ